MKSAIAMTKDGEAGESKSSRASIRGRLSRYLCLLSLALLISAPAWMYESWSATVAAGWIPANWPFGSGSGNYPWGTSNHGPWAVFKELGYGFDFGLKLFFWSFVCAGLSNLARPNITAAIILALSVVLSLSAISVFLPLFD